MKKILSISIILSAFFCNLFADSFTDAIQDLAVVIACKGTYSGAEAGYKEDPDDYYKPGMMATRFARESGNKTKTDTFYGICFNYAQFAFTDIQNYKSWYNEKGMYEGQFWLAGVHDNPNQVELMSIGSKFDYTRLQNGEYIKTYNTSLRNVSAHSGATNHAWIWIERADGVWFWIDPTWTDTGGYVVYGYVKNGKEIQCRPNKNLCIEKPAYLDSLPLPPAMGKRLAPSRTANSKNRQETISDAGTDWIVEAIDKSIRKTFIDVDYNMKNEYMALIVSADIPFSVITDKSFSVNKMGLGLEMPFLFNSIASLIGIEYLQNLENGNNLHSGLFEIDFSRRFLNNFAWYIGGGVGLRFDVANDYGAPKTMEGIPDTGYFAWKVDTGLIINISRIFTKIEVSYNNVFGFSFGAGVGYGVEL